MNIGSMSNNYIIPYSGVSRVTPVNADKYGRHFHEGEAGRMSDV